MVERYSIKFPEWWWSDGGLSRPIFVQPDDSTEKKLENKKKLLQNAPKPLESSLPLLQLGKLK